MLKVSRLSIKMSNFASYNINMRVHTCIERTLYI